MTPRRIGIAGGLAAAVYVFALVTSRGVPDRALALVGGPDGGVARYGGLVLHYRPPPGFDVERYMDRSLARDTRIRRDGDALEIEIPDLSREDAEDVTAILRHGGIEFREVIEDMGLQRMPVIETGPKKAEYVAPGVRRELDSWRPDEGGEPHYDTYLVGYSLDELGRAVTDLRAKGWQLPPHTVVAYEPVEPWEGAADPRPYWRSYLVRDVVELDSFAIDSATGSLDPNTNRPIVLLDFTRDGADVFGDLTARIRGHKLATILGGVVKSAPIINGPIRGGRASITMGGSDPAHQMAERDMLVRVLSSPPLPHGGEVLSEDYQPAPDIAARLLIATLLLALLGGALVGGVFGLMVRVTRPALRPAPARTAGALPLKLVAATLLAPFAIVFLDNVPIPFIEGNGADFLDVNTPPPGLPTPISAGLQPLIAAFLLVELATLVVPRLYRLRHDPKTRITLGKVVAALGVGFALLQGHFIAKYVHNYYLAPGSGSQAELGITVTLAAGTMLLAVAAGAIREYGLGNGYGAILATTWLIKTGEHVLHRPERGYLLGAVGFVAIAAVTWFLLRVRVGEPKEATLRLPTSGDAPLGDARTLIDIVGLLVIARWLPEIDWLGTWTTRSHHRGFVMIALLAGFVVLWSFLFARPRLSAKLAERAKLAPTSMATWRRATALTLVGLVAIAALEALTNAANHDAQLVCDAAMAMLVTAVVLDILDELRARRQTMIGIWPLQQPQHAEVVAHTLREAGIPFHLKGDHLRALLAFFGPYVPIDVMVPAEQADAARLKIALLFEEKHLAAFE